MSAELWSFYVLPTEFCPPVYEHQGGFHLVDLIITELKNDLLKILVLSLVEILLKKNPLQDLPSSLNALISTNERN